MDTVQSNQRGVMRPCLNVACKSYGKPHPHCTCYNGLGPEEGFGNVGMMAEGGCVGSHKEDCEYYADGGEVIENTSINTNPDLAVDHLIAEKGLFHAMTKTGHSRSEDPNRPVQDFIEHAKKGSKRMHSAVEKSFEGAVPEDKRDTEELKAHLKMLQSNPRAILKVGGDLQGLSPAHTAALTSKATSAAAYLKQLRPQGTNPGGLDPVVQPNKRAEYNYDRQLQIAENPLHVLHHAKNGTLTPQDMQTFNSIYPQLSKHMQNKTFNSMADVKAAGKEIDRKHRMGLSHIMGQPLSFVQTPAASQAILQSGAAVAQARAIPKKPTSEQLKTIDKSNNLEATPLQQSQMDKSGTK
jgi:hypothetical protein